MKIFVTALLYLSISACSGDDGENPGPLPPDDRVTLELKAALSGYQWDLVPHQSTGLYDNVRYYFNADGTGVINDRFGNNNTIKWSVTQGVLLLSHEGNNELLGREGFIGQGDARVVRGQIVWETSYWGFSGVEKILHTFTSPDFDPVILDQITVPAVDSGQRNLNRDETTEYAFERGMRTLDNIAQLSDTLYVLSTNYDNGASGAGEIVETCENGGTFSHYFSDNDSSVNLSQMDQIVVNFTECEMKTIGNFGGATFNGPVTVNVSNVTQLMQIGTLELENWETTVDVSSLRVDQRDIYGEAQWNGEFSLVMSHKFEGLEINTSLTGNQSLSFDFFDGSDVVNVFDLMRRDVGLKYNIEVNYAALLNGINDQISMKHRDAAISGSFGGYLESGSFLVETRDYAAQTDRLVTPPEYEPLSGYSYFGMSSVNNSDTWATSFEKWSKVVNGPLFSIGSDYLLPTLIESAYSPRLDWSSKALSIKSNGVFNIVEYKHINHPDYNNYMVRVKTITGTYYDSKDTLILKPEVEYVCNSFGFIEVNPTVSDFMTYSIELTGLQNEVTLTNTNQQDLIPNGAAGQAVFNLPQECFLNSSVTFSDGSLEIVDNLGAPIVEQEPNNEIINATVLDYPGAVSGSIGPADALDYFKFIPPVTGKYKIYVESTDGFHLWVSSITLFNAYMDNVAARYENSMNMLLGQENLFLVSWRPQGLSGDLCYTRSGEFDVSNATCMNGPAAAIDYTLYFEFLY